MTLKARFKRCNSKNGLLYRVKKLGTVVGDIHLNDMLTILYGP